MCGLRRTPVHSLRVCDQLDSTDESLSHLVIAANHFSAPRSKLEITNQAGFIETNSCLNVLKAQTTKPAFCVTKTKVRNFLSRQTNHRATYFDELHLKISVLSAAALRCDEAPIESKPSPPAHISSPPHSHP